jgi:hypothetical protein
MESGEKSCLPLPFMPIHFQLIFYFINHSIIVLLSSAMKGIFFSYVQQLLLFCFLFNRKIYEMKEYMRWRMEGWELWVNLGEKGE